MGDAVLVGMTPEGHVLLDVTSFSGCDWVFSCGSIVGEKITSGVRSGEEADIKGIGF